jgi:ankyrin repeat protein
VHAKSNDGSSALIWASVMRHKAIVEVLRKAGEEQDMHASTTKSKCSDEMMLVYSFDGKLSKLQDCISGGSNVNPKDKDGQTPLIWASFEGHQSIVESLLQAGADVHAKADNGMTPLMIASDKGHKSIVEILRKAGARGEL